MKKLITTIVLFFSIFFNASAQEQVYKDFGPLVNNPAIRNYNTKFDANMFEKRTDNNSIVKNYSDIEGTPYIFEKFIPGEILDDNQQLMMRYNAVTDEVEIQKTENNNVTLLKDNQFNTILMNFGKYKLRLLNYKNYKSEGVYGYLVELFSSETLTLLRKDKIILVGEKVAKTTFETSYPPKFVKAKNEYYIEKKDKTVIQVPKNKKELEAIFPNQKQEIETFFKMKNYSFKEEQDLIEITKFIATL